MTRYEKRPDRLRSATFAACAIASATFATVAMAQPNGPPQGAPQAAPRQVVAQGAPAAQTTIASTETTFAENVTPDIGLPAEQLLLGDASTERSDAIHVIEMLMAQRFMPPFPTPFAEPQFAGFDVYGRPRFVQPQIADLEPVCIRTVQEGSPIAAPIYAITIRNVGDADAGRFRVSLVATLGGIDEFSPTSVAVVGPLAAGETVRVDVQLPLAALAMDGSSALRPFDTLIAAIDSLDQVAERDERDNVLALRREAVLPLEAAVVTETTVSTEIADAPSAPVAAAPAAPSDPNAVPPSMTPGQAGPDEAVPPAAPKIDGGALDELDAPAENAEMRALFR